MSTCQHCGKERTASTSDTTGCCDAERRERGYSPTYRWSAVRDALAAGQRLPINDLILYYDMLAIEAVDSNPPFISLAMQTVSLLRELQAYRDRDKGKSQNTLD